MAAQAPRLQVLAVPLARRGTAAAVVVVAEPQVCQREMVARLRLAVEAVVVPPLGQSWERQLSLLPLATEVRAEQGAAQEAEEAVVPASTRQRRPSAQLRTEIQR